MSGEIGDLDKTQESPAQMLLDLDLDPIPFLGSTALTHVFQKWRTSVALDRTPKEGPLFSWIQYSSDTIKQWRLCDIHQGVTRLPSGHQTSRAVKSTIGFAIFPAINPIFCSFFPARGYPPVNQHRCGKAYHLKILFLEKH